MRVINRTAVTITGGRIEALDESPARPGRLVDLRGATLLPGFHDAHNHMVGFGMSLAEVDLPRLIDRLGPAQQP